MKDMMKGNDMTSHKANSKMTSKPRWRSIAAGLAVAGAVVVAGCSSSGSSSKATSTTVPANAGANSSGAGTTNALSRTIANWKAPKCDRTVTSTPKATAVAGSKSDYDLTSFDGTKIRIHWFPTASAKAGTKTPTVLMGPGWSLGGDTDASTKAALGPQSVVTIGNLNEAGYNVATWDPRGFAKSSGTVTVDSADFEAKDTSALIDWIAGQKGVQLDAPGNPRIGMVGMSYGGGIQFVTAATDCRVDAITPTIAWNSLATSLYPAETYKAGWGGLLVSIATAAHLDPHITTAASEATNTGVLSQDDRQWFVDRGPDDVLSKIHIPTLIVQGTVDNLFPLSEGVRNYQMLAANGIPLAMTWFCGGHGVCNNPADPASYVHDAVMNWLDRYLKGDSSAKAVAPFQTTDQNGQIHTYGGFPPSGADTSVVAFADSGKLALQPDGGSGPMKSAKKGDIIGSLATQITPAKATKALNLPVTVTGSSRMLLGAPQLGLGYTCTLDAAATKPTRIFAQLVDDKTGRVLGNQVTPIQTSCDGKMHLAQVSLEDIAFAAKEGDKLTLQLVASAVAYAQPQMGGEVNFSRIELALPTVAE